MSIAFDLENGAGAVGGRDVVTVEGRVVEVICSAEENDFSGGSSVEKAVASGVCVEGVDLSCKGGEVGGLSELGFVELRDLLVHYRETGFGGNDKKRFGRERNETLRIPKLFGEVVHFRNGRVSETCRSESLCFWNSESLAKI
jgi:hypothetical protein